MKYNPYFSVLFFFGWFIGSCTSAKNDKSKVSVNSDSLANNTVVNDSIVEKHGRKEDSAIVDKRVTDSAVFYIGLWKPYTNVSLPISAMNDQEVNELMKHEVLLSKDSLVLLGVKCLQPSYNVSIALVDQYIKDNYPNINKGYLKLKSDSLAVLKIACKTGGIENDVSELLFDKQRNELIVEKDGVFFYCRKK